MPEVKKKIVSWEIQERGDGLKQLLWKLEEKIEPGTLKRQHQGPLKVESQGIYNN